MTDKLIAISALLCLLLWWNSERALALKKKQESCTHRFKEIANPFDGSLYQRTCVFCKYTQFHRKDGHWE